MNARELAQSLTNDEITQLMLDWNKLEGAVLGLGDCMLREKAEQLGDASLLQMYNLMFEVYRLVAYRYWPVDGRTFQSTRWST